MITALIAVLILLIGCITAILIIFSVALKRVYNQFTEFISPPEAGKPSPLALFIDSCSVLMGRAITAQIKATFMAGKSSTVRADAAIAGDIAEGLAGQNAVFGAILNQFPALRKTLRRNPGLVDIALSKIGGGNGNSQRDNGQNISPAKFDL